MFADATDPDEIPGFGVEAGTGFTLSVRLLVLVDNAEILELAVNVLLVGVGTGTPSVTGSTPASVGIEVPPVLWTGDIPVVPQPL